VAEASRGLSKSALKESGKLSTAARLEARCPLYELASER
jgi:hypothetical protein